jgi:hypothetical protein
MGGRRKIPPRIPIEEFSVESGAVNGVKLFDFPLKAKNKLVDNKREK